MKHSNIDSCFIANSSSSSIIFFSYIPITFSGRVFYFRVIRKIQHLPYNTTTKEECIHFCFDFISFDYPIDKEKCFHYYIEIIKVIIVI